MRFLFLTLGYSPDIDGGGYRYATEVAELLARRGHEVHAVFPNPGNLFPAKEIRKDVALYRLAKASGGFLGNFRAANQAAHARVREILEVSRAPTLIFSHHAYLDPALVGIPFVMILQGPWALEHRYSVTSRPDPCLAGSWIISRACKWSALSEKRYKALGTFAWPASTHADESPRGIRAFIGTRK